MACQLTCPGSSSCSVSQLLNVINLTPMSPQLHCPTPLLWLMQYWDDPADAIRVHEGTLLPLWKFEAEAGRGRHVTALAWSPRYADLLAAGYGSFDAAQQGTGAVACFTLKNPSAPEFLMTTRSGAASPLDSVC